MSTIYEKAPEYVVALAREVMGQYHQRLIDAEVRIDFLFGRASLDENGNTTGPALRIGGHRVDGYCRIISLRDRVKGNGDAEIAVDGDDWGDWDEDYQRALLDHELTHIELVVKNGVLLRDDAHRPKLRCRSHDWEFGFFDEVARRHGPASYELRALQQMRRESPVYAEVKEVA
jgi:hypothetical protein